MIEQKKQLHSSHLKMLWQCGERFRRVVIDGEREPSGVPLIVGSATHSTAASDLINKKDKGFLLTREAVQDFARDNFVSEWQKSQIILNEEERELGLTKIKGIAQDQTIALSSAYHYAVAPGIIPHRIERPWVMEAKGYPFDLSGKWDVDEDYYKEGQDSGTMRIVRIRDTKTRKTDAGQYEVDASDQYTLYSMAKFTLDGVMPDEVVQDTLIKPTRSRPEAIARSYHSKRTKEDFQIFFRRFETACMIIEKGIFTPASSYGFDSPCHYCGFFLDGSCSFVNTKRLLAAKQKQQEGRTNGKPKTKSTADLIAGLTAAVGNGAGKTGLNV